MQSPKASKARRPREVGDDILLVHTLIQEKKYVRTQPPA